MDKEFISKMNTSLRNMRAKVIAAKGESEKGLSPITIKKETAQKQTDRGDKE